MRNLHMYYHDYYTDSRQAFGHRFQVEEKSRDWLWFVGAVLLSPVALYILVA